MIVECVIMTLTFVLALIGLIRSGDMRRDPTDLLKQDTLVVSASDKASRIAILLQAVEHQHQVHIQEILANEGTRMQARSIFITAFVALVAVAFSNISVPSSQVTTYVVIGLVGLSYLFDVQLRDLNNRQLPVRDQLRNTIVAITNIPNDDVHWYRVDHDKINSHFETAYKSRWRNKIILAVSPNLEQTVFYFIPTIIFLIIRRFIPGNGIAV